MTGKTVVLSLTATWDSGDPDSWEPPGTSLKIPVHYEDPGYEPGDLEETLEGISAIWLAGSLACRDCGKQ